MAICFEKMLVAAVREAMPLITDSAVAEEADAFYVKRHNTPAPTANTCAH